MLGGGETSRNPPHRLNDWTNQWAAELADPLREASQPSGLPTAPLPRFAARKGTKLLLSAKNEAAYLSRQR